VIEAGVKRVVVGMKDPNPLVDGKGLANLKKAGVHVEVGILEKECKRLNEAFCKYIITKEPFIVLKAAATLDGKIATEDGESKWITGEASRRFVHRLRDQVDGIIVGIGTILKDDPMLTARIKGGRDPYRIILDSRLRIPEESRVIEISPAKTIIATTESASQEKIGRLKKKGVRILILDSQNGRVNLKDCLCVLGEMEMMALLVEGGSQVNGSFLDEGLVDKVLLFLSPKLMGDGKAIGIFEGRRKEGLKDAIPLRELKVRRMGKDILIEGYVKTGTDICSLGS
jgi:diaminohydroxyphosphoribosylaminopyrimidine deaminase/5-amino-6-(5-phosphoribosylamino)uracil reductase